MPLKVTTNETALPGILPLQHGDHRQIASAAGDAIIEVYSGLLGIKGADDMEALIVQAVNAHSDLVAAARRIVREYRTFVLTIGAIEDAEEALAKAGAA